MARIGLLSDSHGRAGTTRRGVELLLQHGIDRLIHLGDIGSVEVIDALCVADTDGKQLPAHLVFGNTDWDLEDLRDYALELDLHVDHPAGRLSLDGDGGEGGGPSDGGGGGGGELVFCHGHEEAPMQEALARGARYLCHGHTHRQADERRGPTRIINPGALFRARTYSVALLDTATDNLEFYPLLMDG